MKDMPLDLDNLFSTHARALATSEQRLQLLAANIANADTPNYKARDIDFQTAMQAAGKNTVRLEATHSDHIGLAGANRGNRAEVMYRVPSQPSLDGNTVDSQRESSAVAETAVRYQATLTFINQRINGLRLAITGRR